jgi:predicted glycosyltransferase
MERLEHARILMYSHDTFGLGHLTRCRTIATALVRRFKGLFVLIVTGSPIAGRFGFPARVDFVKIPSVIKLYNGEYASMHEHIDLQETLDMRKAIIRQTAEIFNPDMLIVDKVPLGLKGELTETLGLLKQRRGRLVLGLRDVMDSPERMHAEWAPNNVLGEINDLYDRIWIYGMRDFWHPFKDLDLPEGLEEKLSFTGFLRREPVARSGRLQHTFTNPYLLVTVGGGGDGENLIRQVLQAYESDDTLPHPALLVLGPFMNKSARNNFRDRAAALVNVEVIDFENNMSQLMRGAIGVVAMGGYNTFCEILSYNKRAIVVPRTEPRREQLIRAKRAQELGLITMLDPSEAAEPMTMADALRRLPQQPLPSETDHLGLLDGLEIIGDEVAASFATRQATTTPTSATAEG